jgi:hypothetical protein
MEQKLIAQKLAAGFIKQAVAVKIEDYWVIVVIEKNGEEIQLTLQRVQDNKEVIRKFATLDSAANVLKKMGFDEFSVFH